MKKPTYILITLLLALIILPILYSTARGSLFKMDPYEKDANLGTYPSKGLVGRWSMAQRDVSGSTINDLSPYNNDGTGQGGVTLGGATDQHGQANRATSFDGTDDAAIIGDVLDNVFALVDGKFTVSFWFKANSFYDGQAIVAKYANLEREWSIESRVSGGNSYVTFLYSSSGLGSYRVVRGSTALQTGQWYHLTMIYDGSVDTNDGLDRPKFYLNNALETNTMHATSGALFNIIDAPSKLAVGAQVKSDNTVESSFNGSIADVRIYNRALSSTEISNLYSNYRPKQAISSLQKGLVGQWKLDQASNKSTTVTADATPYGNNGTGVGGITLGGATDQHGQANRATSFDGTDDYVRYGDILDNIFTGANAKFSVSYWIKNTTATPTAAVISKYGYGVENQRQWFIGHSATYEQYMLWYGDLDGNSYKGHKTTTKFTSQGWYHVVWEYDGTQTVNNRISAWVNGVQETLTLILDLGSPSSIPNGTAHLGLGAYLLSTGLPAETSTFHNGSIDDFRIYNRNLSQVEITSLYNSYRPTRQISSLYKGLVLDMPLAQKDLMSSTTIADKTPYSNTGTLVGSPSFTTDRHGQSNKAMSFNGSSQYVNLKNSSFINLSNDFTISAWFKPTNATDEGQIYAESNTGNNGPVARMGVNMTSGAFYYHFRNDSESQEISNSVSGVTVNNWHHGVLTKTGTTFTLYLNGTSQSSTNTMPSPLTINTVDIGVWRRPAAIYFTGSIANVKVWNRALSATEVSALYNSY